MYPKNSDTTQGYYLQYTAAIPNGKAIVVLPGGGYNHVAVNHEGKDVAQWLVTLGYDVFVLHYRVSNNEINYYHPAQLQDVTKTVNHIRKQYKKIGIMGFSAGGHLAGIYLTSKNNKVKFGILVYPVITSDSSFWHRGSFKALLGNDYTALATKKYAVEKQITKKTPPLWLMHCKDDRVVPFQNSVAAYEASRPYRPETALHLFEKGGHGFGMRSVNAATDGWKNLLEDWLQQF